VKENLPYITDQAITEVEVVLHDLGYENLVSFRVCAGSEGIEKLYYDLDGYRSFITVRDSSLHVRIWGLHEHNVRTAVREREPSAQVGDREAGLGPPVTVQPNGDSSAGMAPDEPARGDAAAEPGEESPHVTTSASDVPDEYPNHPSLTAPVPLDHEATCCELSGQALDEAGQPVIKLVSSKRTSWPPRMGDTVPPEVDGSSAGPSRRSSVPPPLPRRPSDPPPPAPTDGDPPESKPLLVADDDLVFDDGPLD
jgi:hypothetical protein